MVSGDRARLDTIGVELLERKTATTVLSTSAVVDQLNLKLIVGPVIKLVDITAAADVFLGGDICATNTVGMNIQTISKLFNNITPHYFNENTV
jgi:hypothetical protein